MSFERVDKVEKGMSGREGVRRGGYFKVEGSYVRGMGIERVW